MLGSQASASGSASALGSFAVPRLPTRGTKRKKRNDVVQAMSNPKGKGKGKEKAQEDNTDKWTEW